MFTEPMRQLVAVVLESETESVTQALLKLGALHLTSVAAADPEVEAQVKRVPPPAPEESIVECRKRIDGFLDMIGVQAFQQCELTIDDLAPLDLDQVTQKLDSLAAELHSLREEQQEIQKKILKLGDIRRQLELFGDLGKGLQARSHYSFLSIQAGSLPATMEEALQKELLQTPSVLIRLSEAADEGARVNLLLISMKKDETLISKLLGRFQWEKTDLPKEKLTGQEGAVQQLALRLSALRHDQEVLSGRADDLLRGRQEDLLRLWQHLRLHELCTRIRSSFRGTSKTVILTGWVPARGTSALEAEIKRVTQNRCHLEWHNPDDPATSTTAEVPVHLHTWDLLRPFQMLVRNFSLPEYGSLDPTPFVTIAYLVMFGLMFGDAGHGAVLMLLGALGVPFFSGRRPKIADLMRLMIWCGGAAVLAGILFGAYFGLQWFPPLWFDYHGIVAGHEQAGAIRNIYDILRVTIIFGIGIISLGLALNWINLIAKRRWQRLIFDKAGLIGAWLYGCGIYTGFYFAEQNFRAFPPPLLLGALFGIPILLLGLNPVLHFLEHRNGERLTITALLGMGVEWMVEILEIFAGYLANTLSFMRVAGLGIAHVCLVIAVFSMADMFTDASGAYTLMAYVLLVLGHGGIILLEGLSAGIQSLRLNYYEFFSKYFVTSTLAYSPVSLKSED